jgi:hypothetical protein
MPFCASSIFKRSHRVAVAIASYRAFF